MVIRFIVGLMAIFINEAYCQNGQNYGYSPQNGNYLHNNFPQGGGGTYRQTQAQSVHQAYSSLPQHGANQNTKFGTRYQSSNQPASPYAHPLAHGVVQYQQPRAQPLPRAYTQSPINPPNTELAPLATAHANFPSEPQTPQNQQNQQSQQNQQVLQSQQSQQVPQNFNNFNGQQGQFFYPPSPTNNFNAQQNQFQQPQTQNQFQQPQTQNQFQQPQTQNQFQQPQTQNQFQQPQTQNQFQQPNTNSFNGNNGNFYNNPYANNTNTYREPVINYTFKEGTPPYYCAYGLPVPEYNTPRKKCIPWHPGCGIIFTCIMDV